MQVPNDKRQQFQEFLDRLSSEGFQHTIETDNEVYALFMKGYSQTEMVKKEKKE